MTKATQLLFRAVEVIPGKIMTVRLRFCPGLGSCRVYLFGWLIKKPFVPPPLPLQTAGEFKQGPNFLSFIRCYEATC
jgi:hypothetical protein